MHIDTYNVPALHQTQGVYAYDCLSTRLKSRALWSRAAEVD